MSESNFNPIFLTESYFSEKGRKGCDNGDDVSDASDAESAPEISTPAPSDALSALSGMQPSAPSAPEYRPSLGNTSSAPAPSSPSFAMQAVTGSGDTQLERINTALASQPKGPGTLMRNILVGALAGMANSAGGKNFGEGLGLGAAGVEKQKQQEFNNQLQQKYSEFESLKAANFAIQSFHQAREADDAHELTQAKLTEMHNAALEHAQELGFAPKLVINSDSSADLHAQAKGGLETLAMGNGGKIPQVTSTNDPATGVGENSFHKINVYSVNSSDVTSNPNGTAQLINQVRAVKMPGAPPLDQSSLQIAGGQAQKGDWRKGVASMANDAQAFLYTAPTVSKLSYKDGKGQSENAATLSTLNQQLAGYKSQAGADPQVTALLQHKVDVFSATAQDVAGKFSVALSSTVAGTADAEAAAAAKKETAVETAKQSVTKGNAGKDYASLVQTDTTGWRPPSGIKLNENQIVSASEKYANSKAFTGAQSAEQSFQMMSNAFAERADAKVNGKELPSGAQSMIALSTHLNTTFGNVKGARVTKDMIAEHLGARSVSDAAQVAVQKLTNGDVLSDSQWDAFHDLIGQSRQIAWGNATQTAHAMNLPMRSDLLPQDGGKTGGKPAGADRMMKFSDGHAHYSNAQNQDLGMVR